jgi:hypothetical protein
MMFAAGLARDVPHAVQHALTMRMRLLIDAAVDEFTEDKLPLLSREIRLNEERKAQKAFRPDEGLDPEYDGLDLDPAPAEGAPYLFTFGELAAAEEEDKLADDALWSMASFETDVPAPEPEQPLSFEEREALRAELRRADTYAERVGRKVCAELEAERERILAGIAEYIEPQVKALLADLDSALDSPIWPH